MMSSRMLSAALLLPTLCAAEHPAGLVLLQNSAKMMVDRMDSENQAFGDTAAATTPGASVPLTDRGYETVAALKDDGEMMTFIKRMVHNEARFVKEESELAGLTPYYSGKKSTQSLDALRQEIRGASWVAEGTGRVAPLDQQGYQQVANMKSVPHMKAFCRRILDKVNRKVTDEGALNGVIPYFNGEISVQSYEKLETEMLEAPWSAPRGLDTPMEIPAGGPETISALIHEAPIHEEEKEADPKSEVSIKRHVASDDEHEDKRQNATFTVALSPQPDMLLEGNDTNNRTQSEEHTRKPSDHAHHRNNWAYYAAGGEGEPRQLNATKRHSDGELLNGSKSHAGNDTLEAHSSKRRHHAKAEGKENSTKANSTKANSTKENSTKENSTKANKTELNDSNDTNSSSKSWFGWLTR